METTNVCVEPSKCKVELSPFQKLEAFDLAISASDNFEIISVEKDDTIFVLQDNSKNEKEMGHQIEIDVAEVISSDLGSILDVLNGRSDVVVKSYTRVVGYYSNTHNWNASKIGELRDRAKGSYGVPGFQAKNQDERLSAINKL